MSSKRCVGQTAHSQSASARLQESLKLQKKSRAEALAYFTSLDAKQQQGLEMQARGAGEWRWGESRGDAAAGLEPCIAGQAAQLFQSSFVLLMQPMPALQHGGGLPAA